jgi:hypothetical protein
MTEQHPGAPRPHDETSPLAAQPATTATAPPPPPPPYAGPYGEAAAPPRKPRLRDRIGRVPRAAWLSAAAVVVIVGVGLGGFFVGRATAPDGGGWQFDNGQRPDFPGGGPGNGQMPGMPGQQSAPSTDDDIDSDGSSSTEGNADATSWYVVPQAS